MVGGIAGMGYVTMGGMFTILKVRDDLTDDEDPGWYEPDPAELARAATDAELRRDGVHTG